MPRGRVKGDAPLANFKEVYYEVNKEKIVKAFKGENYDCCVRKWCEGELLKLELCMNKIKHLQSIFERIWMRVDR